MSIIVNPSKKLTLWNKLGGTTELENSEIGPNLTPGSVNTFVTGKFGDGQEFDATSNIYTEVPLMPKEAFPKNMGQMTIEWWFKSMTSIPNDKYYNFFGGSNGVGYFTIDFRTYTTANNYSITTYYGDTASDYNYAIWRLGNRDETRKYFGDPTYSGDGLWHHFAVVYDLTLSTAIERTKFYKDGVSIVDDPDYVSFTDADAGNLLDGYNANSNVRVGKNHVTSNPYYQAPGVMDNVKIWSYPKTDFSDRFVEAEFGAGIEYGKSSIIASPTKKLILWNKLGSTDEVTESEVGPNGSFEGTGGGTPEYSAVKFGDGFRDTTIFSGIDFPLDIKLEKGAVEFWIKWASVPASQADTAIWGTGGYVVAPYPDIRCYWSGNNDYLVFSMEYDGSNYVYVSVNAANLGYTSAGQVMHIACSWDYTNGTGNVNNGSDVWRVWADGVEITSFTTDRHDSTYEIWRTKEITEPFGICNLRQAGLPCDCYIDNIKVYNYPKSDFSDRLVEYPDRINGTNIYTSGRLILWNKLGGPTEVENSEIGPDGTLTGGGTPTYTACKFDDGFYNSTAFEGIDFEQQVSLKQGTIELYIKPPAVPGSQANSAFVGIAGASVTYPHVQCYYTTSGTKFYFLLATSSGVQLNLQVSAANAGYISADQVIHVAFVWNADGSGPVTNASDVIDVYFDGVKMTSFVTDSASGGITYANLQSAVTPDIALNYSRGAGWANDIVLDNFKLYNYAKTDFSDRNIESPIDISKVVLK